MVSLWKREGGNRKEYICPQCRHYPSLSSAIDFYSFIVKKDFCLFVFIVWVWGFRYKGDNRLVTDTANVPHMHVDGYCIHILHKNSTIEPIAMRICLYVTKGIVLLRGLTPTYVWQVFFSWRKSFCFIYIIYYSIYAWAPVIIPPCVNVHVGTPVFHGKKEGAPSFSGQEGGQIHKKRRSKVRLYKSAYFLVFQVLTLVFFILFSFTACGESARRPCLVI